jgi:hypothetical protein
MAQVGAMRLDYAESWKRGEAIEELESDSVILHAFDRDDGLTVFLPKRAVVLKIGTEQFFDQLERRWRAQYGSSASLSRIESAGREWRVCVRPSLERPATVFHLVTVHAGQAHHMLAVGSRLGTEPPRELLALLRRVEWDHTNSSGGGSATTPPNRAASLPLPASPAAPAVPVETTLASGMEVTAMTRNTAPPVEATTPSVPAPTMEPSRAVAPSPGLSPAPAPEIGRAHV